MKYIFIFLLLPFLLFSQTKGASPIEIKKETAISKNIYAVVVGISDYQDPAIPDLRFADKDAEAFANYLRSNAGGKLDGDHLKVLINKEATMAQFANALDWLWEVCKEGDQAIIYFSGHGDVEKKSLTQPGFLLCWDAPARVYMAGGAFALPMLQEVVSTLSIQNKAKVIVITDACRSGTLAGSSVGGSQATAANLAKQFGNEIKIMSCQPNEYSIEGEQWGGGRGAFSYHLLDALYGMADNNNDLWVTLQEVGRYLEDHVTNEVAPVSQVPMIVGNRNEQLTSVDAQMLASIKSGKTNQMMLSAIEARGIEEDVLSKLDTTTKITYQLFKAALKNKTFLQPANACANTYYEQLIKEPKLERLHSTMKRNYAAALQDDAQQVINALLKSEIDENIISNQKRKAIEQQFYAIYLERAAELLGPQHYMYKSLKARKCYFEGNSLGMQHTDREIIRDTAIISQIIAKYREALNWESDLPYVYMNLGMLYGLSLMKLDSAEYYLQNVIKSNSTWILGYSYLFNIYKKLQPDKARFPLEQANQIDSSSPQLLFDWASYYATNKQFEIAEMTYLKLLQLKEVKYCIPCVHNSLGLTYASAGRYKEAEKEYLIAYELDSLLDPIFNNLGMLYVTTNRYVEAEQFLNKDLIRHPEWPSTYSNLAALYLHTNRQPLAETFYKKALEIDSTNGTSIYWLADIYLKTRRIKETEDLVNMGIRHYPENEPFNTQLGLIYLNSGRINNAEMQFKKVLTINPNNAYAHFQLGLIYNQLKRYEESAMENRKAIQLNPEFPVAYYNLTCALSMQNKIEEAFPQLELAIQKGFNQYENIQHDTDLENLKNQKEKWDTFMKKYFPDKMK
ncbi:MAG: tetratricopeptide repeat protein [Saprospiraceae bacterium]